MQECLDIIIFYLICQRLLGNIRVDMIHELAIWWHTGWHQQLSGNGQGWIFNSYFSLTLFINPFVCCSLYSYVLASANNLHSTTDPSFDIIYINSFFFLYFRFIDYVVLDSRVTSERFCFWYYYFLTNLSAICYWTSDELLTSERFCFYIIIF